MTATDPPNADRTADRVLDARDLRCPLPVLRARKVLVGMEAGAVLEVCANDPASVEDFRRFCEQGAADLVAQHAEGDGLYRHWLRRRPA
ncbi:sulfurtransferase TusA family protein [Roseospira goensis]|uniref:tRNA 2-thiouridine synthesizing protein A n=1 Tax=Roseospira goensis TaxID=391922 RepID=A0A7W6S469_9PROT|nr:sulfurtransferase TusA family protein [Roseospira goensis]MBB4287814.1 tRNA 2-thiouridine synthesizing protein A [Roseospira goensis]